MQQADAILLAHQLNEEERIENSANAWHYDARLVMDGRTYAVAVSDSDGIVVGLLPL